MRSVVDTEARMSSIFMVFVASLVAVCELCRGFVYKIFAGLCESSRGKRVVWMMKGV
jgi:hypothetical protein